MSFSGFTVMLVVVLVGVNFESSRGQEPTTTPTTSENNKPIIKPISTNSPKMASLDNLTKESVVGDVIDSQPGASIEVTYDSNATLEQGNELKPTQVKDLPKIAFHAQKDQLYTLTMVDPDAPSRKEPKLREILHYLVVNIPGDELAKGDTLAEYIGSGPPKGTGLHRYIYLLYKQKGRLNVDIKIPKTSRNGRLNFSIREFAKKHQLEGPIAANFYQAQYDDYVPTLQAQLASG